MTRTSVKLIGLNFCALHTFPSLIMSLWANCTLLLQLYCRSINSRDDLGTILSILQPLTIQLLHIMTCLQNSLLEFGRNLSKYEHFINYSSSRGATESVFVNSSCSRGGKTVSLSSRATLDLSIDQRFSSLCIMTNLTTPILSFFFPFLLP